MPEEIELPSFPDITFDMTQGQCVKQPWLTDLFFAVHPTHQREAKDICSMCPVKQDCFEFAMANVSVEGIWGGTTTSQRVLIRKTLFEKDPTRNYGGWRSKEELALRAELFARGLKVCSKCRLELPLERYHNRKCTQDGLNWQCKECHIETKRASDDKRKAKQAA